ncbi:MAG TPA: hypothetical protein PKC91_12975 [Ignavibacteria bacterium]|nr:hypothetical protein [Ignavibacteria bacterium]
MKNNKVQLDTLNEIKNLMQRSSRFVSLSGIAGMAAGIVAVSGAVIISIYLQIGFIEKVPGVMLSAENPFKANLIFIFTILFSVFILALILTFYFSSRNAKRKNIIFWDSMAKKVFANLLFFLITGGMFCLILLYYGIYFLIVSSMLIFYGLALINLSKFTFNEIAQLGIIEICLGVIAAFIPVYPVLFWMIGFGVLHLIYGIYVYLKYERD